MTSLRTAELAWREVLRASTSLMRTFEEQGDFGGLAPREYDVLRALAETDDGEARLGILASVTYLPQPSMSRLVERMERDGLVSRCPDPDDGRGRLVRLTAAGRERYTAVGRVHVRSIHRVVGAALSEAEARQLADLARRLRGGTQDALGSGSIPAARGRAAGLAGGDASTTERPSA